MSSLGGSTSTVGGGANTDTSNMFNQFLQQGLGASSTSVADNAYVQQRAQVAQQLQDTHVSNANDVLARMDAAHAQTIGKQNGGGASGTPAPGDNGGLFNTLVNNQANQTPQGIINNNPYLQQAGQILQAPSFVNPTLGTYNTQAPTNDIFSQLFGAGNQFSIPNVDASQFGANGQFAQGLSQGVGQVANVGSVIGSGGIGQLLNPDTNSPLFAALKSQQAQQDKAALATNNARFGSGGGQALGTGAQYANAQYEAQANPANLLALNTIGTQQQQLDLTNRQASADALLTQRGQDVTSRGQDVTANIASANLHQQGMQAALQAYLSALQGNQQTALGRLGIGENTARDQATNALNQFNAGNNAIGLGNRDQIDLTGQHNTFNRDIFGQQSQNQTNLGQLGLGITGQQQSGIQNLLNQLFNSYNNANKIGSPQAQTVQNPSDAGQIAQLLGAVAKFIPGLSLPGSSAGTGGLSSGGVPAGLA